MEPQVKTCFKCGQEKPVNQFYRHPRMADGRLNKCKECNKKDVRDNYQKNIEYYRAYDLRRYRENEERREKTLAAFNEWTKRNPAGKKASEIVTNAIRDGRLKRQSCEVCGEAKAEAHHPDYKYPLKVMWLCRSHHVKWHKKHGPGKNADLSVEEMEY